MIVTMANIEEKYKNYTVTRFQFNPRREAVWSEINRYLQRRICFGDLVVEVGSGYCNWINAVKAKNKVAIDKFIDPRKFCKPEIKTILGDYSKIKELKNNSVDTFLLSNFLEHLDEKEVKKCIQLIRLKLKLNGIIIIIQPNYIFSSKKYFDDPTHISIWDHKSMYALLRMNNFKIVKVIPRFLPLEMKSRLPKNRFLIRFYLNSKIKPFGGQMLLIARKS